MFPNLKAQFDRRPFTNGLLLGTIIFFATYIPVTNLWAPELIEIRGQSMFPTLENGNRVVFITRFDVIKRGDIVSFIAPSRDAFYCKRVIGLPGDKIILVGNEIIINDEVQSEYYIAICSNERPKTIVVPPLHYFVMGDNREWSMDSRSFGCIPKKDVLAKMFCKVW